jgi:universal stress protein family protein
MQLIRLALNLAPLRQIKERGSLNLLFKFIKRPNAWIVIGTHGRRGISRLFLGSVAEALARISSKPLLLIRGG